MTRFIIKLVPILSLLILIQCKSTPKKEEKPPEPAPAPVVMAEPVVERAAPVITKDEEMEIAVRPSLNLRSAAGLRGRILDSIPYGKRITVLDRLEDDEGPKKSRSKWYKVKYDGETGYVNAKYLRESGDDRVVQPPKRVKRRRKARKATRKASAVKPESVEPTIKKKI